MRSLWAAGILLRRLRTDATMVVLLVVLVAATSFVFAAAPRLFNRVADDALRHTMRTALPAERNVIIGLASAIDPGPAGGVAGVRAVGDEQTGRLPASLANLIAERTLRITATRFYVTDTAAGPVHLSLRYQDGLTDATRLVSGRWPRDRSTPQPPAATAGNPPPSPPGGHPIVMEVALSTATASQLGLDVGDMLPITVDGSDPLLPGIRYQIAATRLLVTGVFEAIDSRAEYWDGDASLIQVTLASMSSPEQYAAAYMPAEAYPGLWSAGMPFSYEWRYQVDPERIDAGQLDQLQEDLRDLGFVTGTSEFGSPGVPILRTGLSVVLDRFAAERARAQGILSMAAIGPFVVASGAVFTVAILLVMRRRSSLLIARGRGASSWLVLGTQLWEALLLAGGGALVGLAAVSVVPGRDSGSSTLLALGVGLTAVLLLIGATWPLARRSLGHSERDDPPVIRVSPRRLVIELTIVGIALAGVVLLRQRGMEAGTAAAADPLLLAVPVLSGVAAGIVAQRFFPVPVRGLGWLAARRRDLVPVLGLRNVGRHAAATNLFLVVLLLTSAFVAFGSVIVTSLDRGQVVASYQRVGADYRVEQTGIGSVGVVDPTAIAGVEAAAFGYIDPTADFTSVPNQRAAIYLDAIDAAGYAAVTVGTPAAPRWPAAFAAAPPGAGAGTEAQPIPAILSGNLPTGSADLHNGDTFSMAVAAQPLTFWVVGRRDSVPGIGQPAAFALVPYAWVERAGLHQPARATDLWLRGSADAAAPLAEALTLVAGSTRVTSRHEVLAALREAPFGAAIVSGFALAVVVAAIYLALTIIGALVLSSARRTRDLAYLRTLGVTGGQALALTVTEHAPAVLLAVIPGALLGVGVGVLLEPSLGLGTFIGAGNVPPFVDWPALALLTGILIAVVTAAVVAGTWLSRRARLVNALRVGED
jgi:putative ABC transport system permease protein